MVRRGGSIFQERRGTPEGDGHQIRFFFRAELDWKLLGEFSGPESGDGRTPSGRWSSQRANRRGVELP